MAKETIVINKRSYKAKELDFNFLCELGENGIDIQDIDKKILPVVRIYVAYCMGVDNEIAGNEISRHIINGGTFDDFTTVFNEKAESCFCIYNKLQMQTNSHGCIIACSESHSSYLGTEISGRIKL
jgi:hypothetical protein